MKVAEAILAICLRLSALGMFLYAVFGPAADQVWDKAGYFMAFSIALDLSADRVWERSEKP